MGAWWREGAFDALTEMLAMAEPAERIGFEEFQKVKLRVGRVVEAVEHPDADRLIVLQVDLGDERRQIMAGLKQYYQPEDLLGRKLVLVANLAPRRMRGLESQGMLLAASTDDHGQVVCLTTMSDIPPGSAVS